MSPLCSARMDDNFYVYLLSSASEEYFPDNTLTHFTVKLAKRIDLSPELWEVGLAELHYSTLYDNGLETDSGMLTLPVRTYASAEDLISTIIESLPDDLEIRRSVLEKFWHFLTEPQWGTFGSTTCTDNTLYINEQPFYFPATTYTIEDLIYFLKTDPANVAVPTHLRFFFKQAVYKHLSVIGVPKPEPDDAPTNTVTPIDETDDYAKFRYDVLKSIYSTHAMSNSVVDKNPYIFIYSDLVKQQLVGGEMVRLLRLTRKQCSDTNTSCTLPVAHHTFDPIH